MTPAPLVLAAHGSADPRFAQVIESLATSVRQLRPELEVRVGYLDHGPDLRVASVGGVTVPVFLARGHHVQVDVPARADVVTRALGPDPRLAAVLAERLREAGWDGQPVALAAVSSTEPQAHADVAATAAQLAAVLRVAVSVDDVADGAVASYLLAPGGFADRIAGSGATIVSKPLGADPRLAEIIVDRYDEVVDARSGAQPV
jgi:sirohydrochlorin ferrochelatase